MLRGTWTHWEWAETLLCSKPPHLFPIPENRGSSDTVCPRRMYSSLLCVQPVQLFDYCQGWDCSSIQVSCYCQWTMELISKLAHRCSGGTVTLMAWAYPESHPLQVRETPEWQGWLFFNSLPACMFGPRGNMVCCNLTLN